MTKNTLVFLEAERHFKVTSKSSLHHGFRHNTFSAIREALPGITPKSALVSSLDKAVTTAIPKQTWTDMPTLPNECFQNHNRFHPIIEELSEKFGTTMRADEKDIRELAPEEMGDVVLAGWSVMHVGRCLARLVPLLRSLGHCPPRLLILRSNFVGHNWHWMDWCDAEAMAERHLPALRLDTLYDINFRGIALKALKHCIETAADPSHDVSPILRSASEGAYRPAFVPLLEAIGRRGDDGERFESRWHLKPGTDIWKHAVGGDDVWLARAEDGLKFNSDADFSEGAYVRPSRPILHWAGSGSLAPIIEPVFGASPYPAQFSAANLAYALDFISMRHSLPRLTVSGRMFLEMLPSKAKDIDAPIRWHGLRPVDAGRADDWMARHFKLIKRAVNVGVPRTTGLNPTRRLAMDCPPNP